MHIFRQWRCTDRNDIGHAKMVFSSVKSVFYSILSQVARIWIFTGANSQIWLVKLKLREYVIGHTSHEYGFSPVPTIVCWAGSLPFEYGFKYRTDVFFFFIIIDHTTWHLWPLISDEVEQKLFTIRVRIHCVGVFYWLKKNKKKQGKRIHSF